MFKLLSSQVKYANPWLSVREDQVVRPDGSPGIFGVVSMLPGSTVLAIDHNDCVLFTREFKYGIGRESVELISGGIDGEESPLDCAKRELKEEAGVIAHKWSNLGSVDPFTTVISSVNYMFLAEHLDETGSQTLDTGEILDIVRIPLLDAVASVMNSGITHGATCVAILKVWALRSGYGT